MTNRQITYGSVLTGVGCALTNYVLEVARLLRSSPLEIALSFPVGALVFLVGALWIEKSEVRRGRS